MTGFALAGNDGGVVNVRRIPVVHRVAIVTHGMIRLSMCCVTLRPPGAVVGASRGSGMTGATLACNDPLSGAVWA